MCNTILKVKLLLNLKIVTLKKLEKVSAEYILGIVQMLENTWKIARSFTIFGKSALMHATIACMEDLKHALLSLHH